MKWRPPKMLELPSVVALAVMVCTRNSNRAGASELPCIACRQSYGYVCQQNLGERQSACRSIATTDRQACKLRCLARHDESKRRAVSKCGACEPAKYPVPPPARMQ